MILDKKTNSKEMKKVILDWLSKKDRPLEEIADKIVSFANMTYNEGAAHQKASTFLVFADSQKEKAEL